MFKKKNEDNLDLKSLNDLIRTGKNVVTIMFILGIACLIVLGSYLLKDWGILSAIKTLLKIISPLFIGVIIAWLLDPFVKLLVKKGWKRSLSCFLVFFLFLVILVLFFWMIIPSISDQVQDIIGIVPRIVENFNSWLTNLFEDLTELYNYDFSSIQKNIYDMFSGFAQSITVGFPQFVMNFISSVISGGITLIVSLFIAFYLLFDFNNVRNQLLNFLPYKLHKDTVDLTDRLNSTLKSYVQGTFFVTVILFSCQSIGFTLAGLKAPLVFGIICAITNIIPYVGPYIGGIPAVLVGFTMSTWTGIFTLIAVVICQFLESYILTPIIMSKTMKLHPVTIIIGLLIFEHFFGIIGMLVSTPVISCLKILVSYFDQKFHFFENIRN